MSRDPSLLRECFEAHTAAAAEIMRRLVVVAIAIVVVATVVIGVVTGSAAIALGAALLFTLLAAPMPLAVRSGYTTPLAKLRRAVEASPDAIVSAVGLNVRVNGRRYRRLSVKTADGKRYGLALPDSLIARMEAAYPPREDFETLLARAQAR